MNSLACYFKVNILISDFNISNIWINPKISTLWMGSFPYIQLCLTYAQHLSSQSQALPNNA